MTTQAPAKDPTPAGGLIRTSSVDPEISAAMQLYDRLAPLKNALGASELSEQELQLFAMVAHRSGLDPFAKQIYAIKRAGKVTFQTGIDGYRSTAERTGQYLGSDEATYDEPCPCGKAPIGHPAVARVVVRRAHPSGHIVEQTGVARWHELIPASGQDTQWQKMPFNQLAKCAEANGLRKAFPKVLADVYIADEMAQAGPGDDQALVEAAAKPTARERVAARREAIEQTRTTEEPKAVAGDVVELGGAEPQLEALTANGLCGAPSPYGDGATCGVVAGHLDNGGPKVHRSLDAEGKVTATWPAA